MDRDKLVSLAIELQSLAQDGLYYTKDVYDKERFERIREISALLLSIKIGEEYEKISSLFCSDYGYQTPKVDTRCAIFKDGKLLLVKEKSGKWSVPGGWCELFLSPCENAVKEAKEESGRNISVDRVIAVQSRKNHNGPDYAYGIVKIFYLCSDLGGEFEENNETLDAGYFSSDELPELDEGKFSSDQAKMCFDAYNSKEWNTVFD